MSAFRRPSGALKLVSLAWRKPMTPLTNYPSLLLRPQSCGIPVYKYSTVSSPKEEGEQISSEKKQSASVDPFGIEEVVNSNDKSSILVQGFYSQPDNETSKLDARKAPSAAPIPKPSRPPPLQNSQEADVARSKLSEYDSWLRQRATLNASEMSECGEAESIRETNFGQVRMDADNVPTRKREDHDDGSYVLNDSPERSRPRRRDRQLVVGSNEPVVETIEADHSRRMRASDFLKEIQTKGNIRGDHGAQEDQQLDPREKLVIERIIRPRETPSMDPGNGSENYANTKEGALLLDSNQVPKSYLLPDFNKVTELDMWSVLRHSIVFQNDFLLAINKPSGIPVHSKAKDCRHTVNQFLKKFADVAKCEEVFPIHRIDKETTGVLLFAKDKKVAAVLKEKFKERQIQKVYLGVTKMCPKYHEGTIQIPIGEGKIPGTTKFRRVLRPDLREYGVKATTRTCVQAITNFKVLHSIDEAAFVEIEPVTGYKHQIRVHFGMGLGCPIIGDHKYSHRDRLAPQRLHPHVLYKIKLKQTKVRDIPLHLHCSKIIFTLPKEFTESSEPIHIHANIPYFMKYTLKRLSLIK